MCLARVSWDSTGEDYVCESLTLIGLGIRRRSLAALYSAADVLLAPSYGEGFGVPTVEAQACGTRVIGSGWAATADLVAEDGWLVEGQPLLG